jgi:DNA helicase-2/ATP-dependent DNA helicase PcrA
MFVADLDPKRIPKPLKPRDDASDGEVHVLWCKNQNEEAQVVAKICNYLIERVGYQPNNILLLIRADRNSCFSSVLQEALFKTGIPVTSKTDTLKPLDDKSGREFLAILRLCVNSEDSLAWRTILQIKRNNIGEDTISKIYDLAAQKGLTFYSALCTIKNSPEMLPKRGLLLKQELESTEDTVTQFSAKPGEVNQLSSLLAEIAKSVILDDKVRDEILTCINSILASSESKNLEDLLSTISVSLEEDEQEIDPGSVNIMTMHKAKGLTADAVFLIGAEDECIPGDRLGEEKEGDERRLLYVSLTRAKHALYITYCRERIGPQRYTGRNSGQAGRTLSRFLVHAPIKPEKAEDYCRLHL